MNAQKFVPWLKNVQNVYLAKVNGEDISDYIIFNKQLNKFGKVWFKARLKFFKLLCDKTNIKRQQKGDVLSVVRKNNEVVKFHVAYETTSGFKIQDEEIFNMEKNILNNPN